MIPIFEVVFVVGLAFCHLLASLITYLAATAAGFFGSFLLILAIQL